MSAKLGPPKFNNDLLLSQQDRDLAEKHWPAILHVLEHPELQESFKAYDGPANRAKRRGRTAGFWAIGLGGLALAFASAEHLMNTMKGHQMAA